MLEKMRKRRRIENFELQSLRNLVKEGGPNVVSNFENKFKEIKIEGKRKSYHTSMYTEKLPSTHYTEAERKDIETLYMGQESISIKRFHRSISWSQQRGQSQDRRQRSSSRNGYNDSRSNQDQRSRFDKFDSVNTQGGPDCCDQSQSQNAS